MNEYLETFPKLIHILLLVYSPINHLANKYLEQRIYTDAESPLNWQLNPAKWYHYILKTIGDWSIALVIISAIIIGFKLKWYFSFFFLLQVTLIPSLILGLIRGLFLRFFDNGDYYFWEIQTLVGKTRVLTIFLDVFLYFSLYQIIFQ